MSKIKKIKNKIAQDDCQKMCQLKYLPRYFQITSFIQRIDRFRNRILRRWAKKFEEKINKQKTIFKVEKSQV